VTTCRSPRQRLGEEEGNDLGEGELQWVLDPIDGTANFVKGIPLYSISLALINDEEPVLGVIDVPGEGRRYSPGCHPSAGEAGAASQDADAVLFGDLANARELLSIPGSGPGSRWRKAGSPRR
jgi:fructose-1,6-bisphosphatase/inositol monophosphatase family enzyme